MMPISAPLQKIKTALEQFGQPYTDLSQNAINLFEALGYNTQRRGNIGYKTYYDFCTQYLNIQPTDTDNQNALANNWLQIQLLFQLSEQELETEFSLFVDNSINKKLYESYLFVAIQLTPQNYTRTELANISRQINRHFPMPVMVLFNYHNLITLTVIDRRLNLKYTDQKVLLKVTLIKDIAYPIANNTNTHPHQHTHRAHLEILNDISLPKLQQLYTIHHFEDLHEAWRKILDTELLNKNFFIDLFQWFEEAKKHVKFPSNNLDDPDTRAEINLIRLLTRLIFVWFIKQKDFVPSKLFNPTFLVQILNNFDPINNHSSFYHAILQNLFFATLNRPTIDETDPNEKRAFVPNKSYQGKNTGYGVKNLFRYADKFSITQQQVLHLFEPIPFLNGGLFDCLDKTEANINIDGFSQTESKQAHVPNYLFFYNYHPNNPNPIFESNGLIQILQRYKFTVTENTPIEQEIALDPELLGKVFENLLAAYNPETKSNARKQTGSFYTPRQIVNYMVDQSLVAYLLPKINHPTNAKQLLEQLLAYDSFDNPFDQQQTIALVEALNQLKILDPACGSGAFPMGILHKMVHLLQQLDPDNQLWKNQQREKIIGPEIEKIEKSIDHAEQISVEHIRQQAIDQLEGELERIENIFNRQNQFDDYARKLYLIENCIYGIDIQPIAVQITKLRFFISLVIDQKKPDSPPSDDKSNNNLSSPPPSEGAGGGIRLLPNLETKFVAANSLIQLQKAKGGQIAIKPIAVEPLEEQLKQLRHLYFTAKNRKQKLNYQKQDLGIRQEIAKILIKNHWDATVAQKLATFDTYDQTNFANWFDPEWMLGVDQGFDILIGNPPYIQIQKFAGKDQQKQWEEQQYKTYARTGDIYSLFYERGTQLLKNKGFLCYITSNKWMRANYGEATRRFFAQQTQPLLLIDFGGLKIFEAATVDTNILLLQKQTYNPQIPLKTVQIDTTFKLHQQLPQYVAENTHPLQTLNHQAWVLGQTNTLHLKTKVEQQGKPLQQWDISISRGILTGFNEAFVIGGSLKNSLIAQHPASAQILKPLLRGKDIKAWIPKFEDLWLICTHNGIKEQGIPPIDVTNYPAIYQRLKTFEPQLIKRLDKGDHWTNLRNCAYIQAFEQPKIIYPNMTKFMPFVYDEDGRYYSNDKSFIMTGNHLKYLTCFFNSKLFKYCFTDNFPELQGGTRELRKVFFDKIPVKPISPVYEQMFNNLLHSIVSTKAAGKSIVTLECQLNARVFALYGLSLTEVQEVLNKLDGVDNPETQITLEYFSSL